MARELHDHAGQTLVAMTLNFAALENAAGNGLPEIRKLAEEGRQLSDDLSKEIRTFSYLLHPPLLDEAGLGSALRWYVNGFSERSKIEVDLELPPDLGRLPDELELVVFRVVQESLTNIHRHSGSPSARILLSRKQGTIELEISDQGRGISPDKQRETSITRVGVGLRGMEERVRQFNGDLRIDSDSTGTRVSVVLPIVGEAV
jgi:signal transduction histidine kinase